MINLVASSWGLVGARLERSDRIDSVYFLPSVAKAHQDLCLSKLFHGQEAAYTRDAWEATASPGNKYWVGFLAGSGDPAATCMYLERSGIYRGCCRYLKCFHCQRHQSNIEQSVEISTALFTGPVSNFLAGLLRAPAWQVGIILQLETVFSTQGQ